MDEKEQQKEEETEEKEEWSKMSNLPFLSLEEIGSFLPSRLTF